MSQNWIVGACVAFAFVIVHGAYVYAARSLVSSHCQWTITPICLCAFPPATFSRTRAEEAMLVAELGEPYKQYMKRVNWRFFPMTF